jgi:hypothetical protein
MRNPAPERDRWTFYKAITIRREEQGATMQDIYEEMMAACQKISASFPPPRFYGACTGELQFSRLLFAEDPTIGQCRQWASHRLSENYGHGLDHAVKVAVEAGALVQIEGRQHSLPDSARQEAVILAQIAGLLHDLNRTQKDHARSSAQAAEEILGELSILSLPGQYVIQAIANHEAFTQPDRIDSPVGQMISDALYDADKFRWGPDNFTITLWQMLRSARAPVAPMIHRFPGGMKGIARIKETFRTETGKRYGPEFIDLGLHMGEKIFEFLKERFTGQL